MKAISTALAALAFTAAMSAGPGSEAKACFGSCDGGFFLFDVFHGVTNVFLGDRGCYRRGYAYEDRGYRRRHYRRSHYNRRYR